MTGMPLIAAALAAGTLCGSQPPATEEAVRFDEARLLVERVPSKKLVVADNLAWLKEGKIPAYAEGNVVRWLELKGEDMSAYRKDHVLSDPDLGEPLARRRGFRLGYMLDISRGRVPTMPMLKVYVWSALPITTVVYGALRHYDWTDLRTALRD